MQNVISSLILFIKLKNIALKSAERNVFQENILNKPNIKLNHYTGSFLEFSHLESDTESTSGNFKSNMIIGVNPDSNGDLTSTAWKIVANNVSGSSKTFAATGVLRDTDYKKVEEGVIEITIFVRITGDTVTVS